ncbi:MAG: hypothetical protein IJ247_05545 [Bacilli bacterium]|nr:hypothetical protein [Bacilli bacterium]
MKSRLILLATVLATASLSGCGGSGSKINVDIPGGGTVRDLKGDEEALADFGKMLGGATLPELDKAPKTGLTLKGALEVPNVFVDINSEVDPENAVNAKLSVKDLDLGATVSAKGTDIVDRYGDAVTVGAMKGHGSGKINGEVGKNGNQLLKVDAGLSGVDFFFATNEFDDLFIEVSNGANISITAALPGLAKGSLNFELTDAIKWANIQERPEVPEDSSGESSSEATSEAISEATSEESSSSVDPDTPEAPEGNLPDMIVGLLGLLATQNPDALLFKTYDDGSKALKVTLNKDTLISLFRNDPEPEIELPDSSFGEFGESVASLLEVSSSATSEPEGDINFNGMPIFINKFDASLALTFDADLRVTNMSLSLDADANTKSTHEYVYSVSETSTSLDSESSLTSVEPEKATLNSSVKLTASAKASLGFSYDTFEVAIPSSAEGYELFVDESPAFIADLSSAFKGVGQALFGLIAM